MIVELGGSRIAVLRSLPPASSAVQGDLAGSSALSVAGATSILVVVLCARQCLTRTWLAMNGDRAEDTSDRTLQGIRSLIEGAKAGRPEALSRLFELHEPMMLRWAHRRLGRSLRTLDETRDVLHDAYGIALAKIGSFRMEDNKSFARWLRGIITRVVLRKAGSQYVTRRVPMMESYEPPDLELTPMTRLSLEDLRNHRYRILKESDWTDRLIYRLRVRGCSSSDIGARLGLTDRAVRMRFAKTDARLRLRMRQIIEASPRG